MRCWRSAEGLFHPGDLDANRHAEGGEGVEDLDHECRLGLLSFTTTAFVIRPDHDLKTNEGCLGEGAAMVAIGLLPSLAPYGPDRLDGPTAAERRNLETGRRLQGQWYGELWAARGGMTGWAPWSRIVQWRRNDGRQHRR